MARALYGYVNGADDRQLLELQVARLRRRVRDLEAEVAELQAESVARSAVEAAIDDPTLELNRLAPTPAPALA